MGGALGLAVLGTVAATRTKHAVSAGTAPLHALTDGYRLGFEVGAVLCIAGAVVAATLLRERPAIAAAVEAAPVEEAEVLAA